MGGRTYSDKDPEAGIRAPVDQEMAAGRLHVRANSSMASHHDAQQQVTRGTYSRSASACDRDVLGDDAGDFWLDQEQKRGRH